MEKKNKTAKVAKTKERRISNKKVESLHKYWDAFPGLKRRLIQPVEGENYSLIKPKDIKKAVYANAGVKRVHKDLEAFTTKTAESLFSLSNTEDHIEVVKTAIKHDAQQICSNLPLVNFCEISCRIDYYWPLAEEYYKACKDGGIMACKKHPLFLCVMKIAVAEEMWDEGGNEKLPAPYGGMTGLDLIISSVEYTNCHGKSSWLRETLKKNMDSLLENWEQYDEIVIAEANRRIDNLDEKETKEIAYKAFLEKLSHLVRVNFDNHLSSLIYKLGA